MWVLLDQPGGGQSLAVAELHLMTTRRLEGRGVHTEVLDSVGGFPQMGNARKGIAIMGMALALTVEWWHT